MEAKTASKSERHRRGVPENRAAERNHASNSNKIPAQRCPTASRCLNDRLGQSARLKCGILQEAHQLRDPGIFEDNGRVYLFYSICGEQGLAAAEITFK
jgi:hypothetical protein